MLQSGDVEVVAEGVEGLLGVMEEVWFREDLSFKVSFALCDYLREKDVVGRAADLFIHAQHQLLLVAGQLFREILSEKNLRHLMATEKLTKLVTSAMEFAVSAIESEIKTEPEPMLVSVSLIQAAFRFSDEASLRLVNIGALDHILTSIKTTNCSKELLREAAVALTNLSVFSHTKCYPKLASKNVISWLFMLAASDDPITRYYALFARCVLALKLETTQRARKSGSMKLVEPFLNFYSPSEMYNLEFHAKFRHTKFHDRAWMKRILAMFQTKLKEPRIMAAYHFVLEAKCRKPPDDREIFQEIGAVNHLKHAASSPENLPSRFARLALEIIGEDMPRNLSPQVPVWSTEDVAYWVQQIGFPEYSDTFLEEKVDGDLLLETTDSQLREEIGMKSSFHRKRFLRELDALKMAADYSSVDEGELYEFLIKLDYRLSLFTYSLIKEGLEVEDLQHLTDEDLQSVCRIENALVRRRILKLCHHSLSECCHISYSPDAEVTSKDEVDVFISYRRSNGSQLASLIRVLLSLNSYKVFIDVERLSAGAWDSSLMNNIKAAKNFVIVLSKGALDRCIGDDGCEDWVHKEIKCALESGKNVIPIVEPNFEWPPEDSLPQDMQALTRFNAVNWIHEYQNACLQKLEKFLRAGAKPNRNIISI